jgi:formylglycine-generating enzyme required for sulfatase activity
VPGGTYNCRNNTNFPSTVSSFRLDTYEVTVGRFRRFVDALVTGWRPPPGSGKHTHLYGGAGLNAGTEGGWVATWSALLPPTLPDWYRALECTVGSPTWTGTSGDNEHRPITCLTWYEAYAFCIWDGGFLPTEAEWNYAAAGGSEQRVYPWSSPPSSTTIDATYAVFCSGTFCTSENVGSRSPKGDARWGQADMAGNPWEWVLDYYDPATSAPPCVDCASLTSGARRVVRGGGYESSSASLRNSFRSAYEPEDRSGYIGARCARPP